MKIILNGKTKIIDNKTSVSELLKDFSRKQAVVVELNGKICQNKDHKLQENDQVEIVTFVGGG